MNPLTMTVTQLAKALQNGELTAAQLTEACLARIKQTEPYGAFLTVTADTAREQALRADSARKRDPALSPLAGIPVAFKDNICTRNIRTTCASRMLQTYVPPYDATVVSRLLACGAVTVGKTNMDEFAMGSSTEHSAFFPCRNPADPTRSPGGSSGGSAAAVALGCVPYALASDAGGSARQPAAFCGVVSMRPTYGAVSRYGLVSFAPSMDQICPVTRTVRDNELIYRAIAGHDARDAQSRTDAPQCSPTQRRRIAVLPCIGNTHPSAEIEKALRYAAYVLHDCGYQTEEISLPVSEYALSAYHVTVDAEASSNLARFDGVRYGHRAAQCEQTSDVFCRSRSEGFGEEAVRRILFGTYLLDCEAEAGYYRRASAVRERIRADLCDILSRYDAVLSPVTPDLPPKLGQTSRLLAMYESDCFTIPASLAGLPALSMPSGYAHNGLAAGIQLIGRDMGEYDLYRIGKQYEEVTRRA